MSGATHRREYLARIGRSADCRAVGPRVTSDILNLEWRDNESNRWRQQGSSMRILIVGPDGIGAHWGSQIAACGGDIEFLIDPTKPEQVANFGKMTSLEDGCLRFPVIWVTRVMQKYDLIIVGCKATALQTYMDEFAPGVGSDTILLPLLDGLRHLDLLDDRFGPHRVIGGVCHLRWDGDVFDPPSLKPVQRLCIGPRTPGQLQAATAVQEVFTKGGIKFVLSPHVMREIWENYVYITVCIGMNIFLHSTEGYALSMQNGAPRVGALLDECSAVAAASGSALREKFRTEIRSKLGFNPVGQSQLLIREAEQKVCGDRDLLIDDMLDRARRFGLSAPILMSASAFRRIHLVLGNPESTEM
jgi:2-dehydropantoate 2-reductase